MNFAVKEQAIPSSYTIKTVDSQQLRGHLMCFHIDPDLRRDDDAIDIADGGKRLSIGHQSAQRYVQRRLLPLDFGVLWLI